MEGDFVAFLGSLSPKAEYLRLFSEIVLDRWHEKLTESKVAAQSLARQLGEYRQREQALLEAFVYKHAIDQSAYQCERDRLREEAAIIEARLHEV